MHILTKSLIGVVTTGTIAVGGYYGWNALSSNSEMTLDDWEKQNSAWFKGKWKKFLKRLRRLRGGSNLFSQWQIWNERYFKNKLNSELQRSREFKEWCDSNPKDTDLSEVKEGCN